MSAPWDQAINLRADMLAYYRSEQGRRAILGLTNEMIAGIAAGDISIEKNRRALASALLSKIDGEPYYWSPQMCDLLAQVAATVPDDYRLEREMAPAVDAFLYFAKPLPILIDDADYQQYLKDEWDAEDMRVQVIGIGESYQIVDGVTSYGLAFSTHLKSVEKSTGLSAHIPMPFVSAFWEYDQTWKEQLEHGASERAVNIGDAPEDLDALARPNENESAGFSDIRRIVIAALTLISQHIVVPERTRPSRDSRRRYEREEHEPAPDVHVVTLRRPKGTQKYEGTSEPVDWSCRWWVSPHWHTYWYGGANEVKTAKKRLVLGYTKGPEHLPLKADGLRLFDVKR